MGATSTSLQQRCWRAVLLAGVLVMLGSLGYLFAWHERWLDRDAGRVGILVLFVSLLVTALALRARWQQAVVLTLVGLGAALASQPLAEALALRWFGEEMTVNRKARFEGHPAEDFRLRTIDGETFHLAEQRGKVVVIDTWRSWCPPCLEEMPYLSYASRELAKDGLVVVGLSAETIDVQAAMRRQLDVPFPLLVDDGSLPEMYRTKGYPHTLVIGRDGRVLAIDELHGYYGVVYLTSALAGGKWPGVAVPPPLEAWRDIQQRSSGDGMSSAAVEGHR